MKPGVSSAGPGTFRRMFFIKKERTEEIPDPPAGLLLSFVSFHCNKSHFSLLKPDVDPERERRQLPSRLGVGSCVEESQATYWSTFSLKAQVPVFCENFWNSDCKAWWEKGNCISVIFVSIKIVSCTMGQVNN